VQCNTCGAKYETNITALSDPIDVYSEWIDACGASVRLPCAAQRADVCAQCVQRLPTLRRRALASGGVLAALRVRAVQRRSLHTKKHAGSRHLLRSVVRASSALVHLASRMHMCVVRAR
jgi:hypothetical protein